MAKGGQSGTSTNGTMLVRFQVLTVVSMKSTVFWDIATRSLDEVSGEFTASNGRVARL
jgi:hypothetical protein